MLYSIRPVVGAVVLALACSGALAGPAKKAAAKPSEAASAPVKLELAHNLDPANESRLQGVVDRFNKESGNNLKLVHQEKGDKPAELNFLLRDDKTDMLTHSGEFAALYAVMAKAGESQKLRDLSGDLKAGVVDGKGRLVALPVLYSTPVLFYNKNAFRKAGLNPDQPPNTWLEMQAMLDKLQDAGYDCPYTSSWPVWVHVDNVSAISGVPSATDKGQLTFNGLPQVKHIAMMATWTKANYFKLFGRRNEASNQFHEGQCAMITTDSREYVDFQDAKGVELGVGALPYHDDVYGGRQSSLADGASLWIGAGRTTAQYKQVAKFVSFVLSPEIQVELTRIYGGLPLTEAARIAAQSGLKRDGEKTLEVAYASLKGNGSKSAVRVSNIDPVSVVTNEELEAVWADKKPAKAALDTSVSRGNGMLLAQPTLKKTQPF